MKKNKVCHLTSVHTASDIRIFHKECKSLANAGYDVSLIVQHDQNKIIDNIMIIAIPLVINRLLRMILLPINIFFKAWKQHSDIYHFHDPELIFMGVLLKLFTSKKVIYDVHEDYSQQILYKFYIPRFMRKSVAFIMQLIENLTAKYFDGIVSATDEILNKFFYHNNAISVRNFPITSNFDHTREKRNTDGIHLIYDGGLAPERGITQIVQSLEFINNNQKIRLNLCGKFYPQDYENRIKKIAGFEKVKYYGWVDQTTMIELLRKSDIGIVCFLPEANHVNAMPNKLFEYMIAGLPTIASNFPLWRKIVEENKCGICVDPLDPKEISKAITYLCENPQVRKRMGKNGRIAVKEKYNWAIENKKLLTLYERLLAHD